MKKLILTSIISALLAVTYGCGDKKKEETASTDTKDTPKTEEVKKVEPERVETPKTDMTKFEDALKTIKNPQHDVIKKLLEKGIDAELEEDVTLPYPSSLKRLTPATENIVIKKGATPIGMAAMFCSPKLVNDLIENGANLKVKVNGMDPIAYIVQCDRPEQYGMLNNYLKTSRKIERDNKDVYKDSSMYVANSIIKDNIDDADGKGQTLMVYAIKNDLFDTIKELITYAGAINYTNTNDEQYNKLPLLVAAEYDKPEIFNYFLEKTGNIMVSQTMADGSKITLLNLFFYNGSDIVNKANPVPANFLKSVFGIYKKTTPGLEEIKAMTASNVNQTAEEELTIGENVFPIGTTAAHIAAFYNHESILKGLALLNADFNMKDANGETPLTLAAKQGNTQAIKLLLEAGANPNEKNANDETPLMAAINNIADANVKAKTLKVFANSLADLRVQGANGTALDMVADNPNLSKTLKDKDSDHRNGYAQKLVADLKAENTPISNTLLRLVQGDINAPLPFAMTNNDGLIYPKGATPLIVAALNCDDNIVKSLLLLKADTGVRIKSESEAMLTAYDFADRYGVGDCTNVKAMLKDPKTVTPDANVVAGSLTETTPAVEQTEDTNTTLEETATPENTKEQEVQEETVDVEMETENDTNNQ